MREKKLKPVSKEYIIIYSYKNIIYCLSNLIKALKSLTVLSIRLFTNLIICQSVSISKIVLM